MDHENADTTRAEGTSALTGKPEKSSAGRFAGWSRIWGKEGDARTPYMTRLWIGRLRLHVFHRPDGDPDCHDHPWDFWTVPLTSYVEEVAEPAPAPDAGRYRLVRRIVPAGRPSFRSADHTHRVLGSFAGLVQKTNPTFEEAFHDEDRKPHRAADPVPAGWYPLVVERGPIVTLVWRGRPRRGWGFLKRRDGRWCWTPWKDYVFGAGKSAACE